MQTESTPPLELDTRQRILNAALEVFIEKGYAAATTRAIANRANVNEVTLFRHFGNKQNLLGAIIDRFSPVDGFKKLLDQELSGDYHQDLRKIANFLVKTMTMRPDIMPLVMYESHQVPELREKLESIPRQMFASLISYFERQSTAGKVRQDISPFLLAQSFFLLYSSFAFSSRSEEHHLLPWPISLDVAFEQLMEVFLHGTNHEG